MQHAWIDWNLFYSKTIFSCYVVPDKIHTFPGWVERGLEIPRVRGLLVLFVSILDIHVIVNRHLSKQGIR